MPTIIYYLLFLVCLAWIIQLLVCCVDWLREETIPHPEKKFPRQNESRPSFSSNKSRKKKHRSRPHRRTVLASAPTSESTQEENAICPRPLQRTEKVEPRNNVSVREPLDIPTTVEKNDHKKKNEKFQEREKIVKHCTFRIGFDGRRYAVPLDDPTGTEEIIISTNTQRRTALNGDVVIVEVVPDTDLLSTNNEETTGEGERTSYGRVIEITKRAVDMTNREVVCLLDRYTNIIMVPVDRTMPKMFINKSKHIKNMTITSKERANKLFVVRWVSWDDHYRYPTGVVIAELPNSTNEETSLNILRRVYSVPEQLDNEAVNFVDDWKIPPDELLRRVDYRAEHVITIDPKNTYDYDDGLSIRKDSDGRYNVHIHIADVAYFVEQNQHIDIKARERATSYYLFNNDTIHMLPPMLSTGLCSLHEHRDRLAISVSVNVDKNGNMTENAVPVIEHSVIRCKAQLTYSEAEEVIKGNGCVQEYTRDSIVHLHYVATRLRAKRLGNQRYALNLDGNAASTPQSHMLIEEMMILANQLIARYLCSKYPKYVPIRRQLPPQTKKLRNWSDAHIQNISKSVYLASERDFLGKLARDNLVPSISCDSGDNTIDIMKKCWTTLKSMDLNDVNDQRNVASIICSDLYHPQLVPAVSALRHIMRRAEYVCSGEHANYELCHNSLHMDIYTQCTSPIRRHIDIVVQRILKAALLDEKPPYTIRELSGICHEFNIRSAKSKEFHLKSQALQLALEVKKNPLSVHSVIESVSGNNLMVGFSFYPHVTAAIRKSDVMFRLLKPISRPDVDDAKKHVRVKWKERIYHTMRTSQLSANDIEGSRSRNKSIELSSDRCVTKVSATRWLAMQKSVNEEDMVALRELIQAEEKQQQLNVVSEDSKKHKLKCSTVQEVTCELGLSDIHQKRHHYVEFNRTFAPGDVLQVQLQAVLHRGLLSPKVALINVTPMLDFCAEHRNKPVECFAEIVDKGPTREDIGTYQFTWLPIVEMLTSYSAVCANENMIIHGVQIQWQRPNEESHQSGSFTLPNNFCNARHIRILSPNDTELRYDYLCIRCRDCTDNPVKSKYEESTSANKVEYKTFVAHALVVKTTEDKEKTTKTVFFKVHHFSSPFPFHLLMATIGNVAHRCTIEIITKPKPNIRLEEAVRDIDKAPLFIQDICLLRPRTGEGNALKQDAVLSFNNFEIVGSPFPPLNESQQKAVRSAVRQQFTVIQGPPGTGKTMTGACLVHFFTQMNSKLRNTGKGRPQVLYCGPSNKSVDVIAGYLQRFQPPNKLSCIRVYSKSIEYKDFPPPVEPGPRRKFDSNDIRVDPSIEPIALHFRIRRAPNKFAEVIRAFEAKFGQNTGQTPANEDIEEYRKNILRAEIEELRKHQVILCTCNTAGIWKIPRYEENTNIVQCIIDEAGMCSEPETLIPLVATKPKQIVLVGDHQQLRPIIQENTAKLLEMDISLLERYSEKMEMLDTQYRMHPAICEFPSKTFYGDKLKTARTVTSPREFLQLRQQWPGGVNQPTVFCHTMGREETVSVKTEEGNEMSKANSQEVKQVVRIARTLVNHYNVKPENLVILTQYQLQRTKIKHSLEAHSKSKIDVQTVVKSQGSEWDVVIVSTVRSLPRIEIEDKPTLGWTKHNLGFIADANQMNVALTRARKGLVIVGNQFLLRTDKRWKALLDFYECKGCVIPASEFLPPPRQRGRPTIIGH